MHSYSRLFLSIVLLAPFITHAEVPDVPQLNSYLMQSEAQHKDITPSTQKIIRWHQKPGEVTEYAIVYIHGFSATRQEIEPVPQMVADSLKANIFYTRLTGHGLPGSQMGKATHDDWLRDAREAWEIGKRIGHKVIMISVSTGSTLSAWISAQPFAEPLHAQILISPNFDVADKSAYLLTLPYGLELAQWILGEERGFEPANEEQATYWTTRYPLRAVKELLSLVDTVKALDKDRITAPTLVVYSPGDKVVDTQAIIDNFKRLGSPRKQLIPFEGSTAPAQHCLAGDILSPSSNMPMHQLIMDFIEQSL